MGDELEPVLHAANNTIPKEHCRLCMPSQTLETVRRDMRQVLNNILLWTEILATMATSWDGNPSELRYPNAPCIDWLREANHRRRRTKKYRLIIDVNNAMRQLVHRNEYSTTTSAPLGCLPSCKIAVQRDRRQIGQQSSPHGCYYAIDVESLDARARRDPQLEVQL